MLQAPELTDGLPFAFPGEDVDDVEEAEEVEKTREIDRL